MRAAFRTARSSSGSRASTGPRAYCILPARHLRESVSNPAKYYRNNTSRSLDFLDAVTVLGVRHIVFSSTAAVYGVPEQVPIPEKAPLRPINPYGWSKLFFEQQLKDLAAERGLIYGILRYFNVASADPAGRTGQSPPEVTHLINAASQVAAGLQERLSVFGTDYPTRDGTCVRDYIHVSDLADAHVAVFRHIKASGGSVTFNCGNGQGYSVLEVIRAVETVAKRSLNVVNAARRPGDPPTLIADPTQLLSRLSWRPRFALEDMVATAIAWEQRGIAASLGSRAARAALRLAAQVPSSVLLLGTQCLAHRCGRDAP